MSSASGRAGAVAVLAAALGLVAGACGLPGDGAFRAAEPDEIPFGLNETSTTSTTTSTTVLATTALATTTTVATEPVALYFVSQGRLALVERVRPRPVEPSDALDLLAQGPLPGDSPRGLRSVLPADSLGEVLVAEGTATVDLAPAILELSGNDQLLAFGQLAFTLLGRPGIGRVAFTVEGQTVDPILPDGSLAGGSVSAESYRNLLLDPPPLPPTTSTTTTTTTAPPPPEPSAEA
jgi:spore germination protein GerM